MFEALDGDGRARYHIGMISTSFEPTVSPGLVSPQVISPVFSRSEGWRSPNEILATSRIYPEAPAPRGYVILARKEIANRYADACLDSHEEDATVYALRVTCHKIDSATDGSMTPGEEVGGILVARLNGERGYANCALASMVKEGYRRKGIATAIYDWAERLWGTTLEPYPGGLSTEAEAFWKSRAARQAATVT